MEPHSDHGPLIEALDLWFDILRRRTGAKIPLKPATSSDLDALSAALGLELPPDVVALYEYSNGAWWDSETLLEVFLPDWGGFVPTSRHLIPVTWHLGGHDKTGPGYDDLPGREWELHIPVFAFRDSQVSVMSAPSVYQAVGLYSFSGAIYWPARRLSEFVSHAVELENRGLLEWDDQGRPTIQVDGEPEPFDPDLVGYPGWRWEPIGSDSWQVD